MTSRSISFNLKNILAFPNLKFSELDESIEYLYQTQSSGLVEETLRDKLKVINLKNDFAFVDELIRVG